MSGSREMTAYTYLFVFICNLIVCVDTCVALSSSIKVSKVLYFVMCCAKNDSAPKKNRFFEFCSTHLMEIIEARRKYLHDFKKINTLIHCFVCLQSCVE